MVFPAVMLSCKRESRARERQKLADLAGSVQRRRAKEVCDLVTGRRCATTLAQVPRDFHRLISARCWNRTWTEFALGE